MNIFSFIKQRLSIVDVISQYTTLKKAGSYFKGSCPFHSEKTASFTVSPHKEIFYCFGCHANGDIISFIAKIENCSQIEAAQQLIDRYQIELPESLTRQQSGQAGPHKERHFELCKYVASWMHEQLRKHQAPLRYLQSRGFSASIIDQFGVGYFPSGQLAVRQLIAAVQKENLLADDLLEAHILAQGKSGLYCPFEERIIFPIKDHLGRFCGFGGRIYAPHDDRPKYYNSKENSHFAKGSLLFGLDRAKSAIQKTDTLFLVEGYTDCLAMAQHGYPNTVATLGTACTLNHLKLIARYAHTVYVLYDGDAAGQQAIMKLTQLCWQVNLELRVIQLPADQDPASLLLANNSLEVYLHQSQEIFEFFISTLGTDFNSRPLNQKIELTRSILETILPLEDTLKQDILLQKTAKLCEVPFESLKHELIQLKHASAQSDTPAHPPVVPVAQTDEGSILEKRVFCAILQNIPLCSNEHVRYLIEYIPGMLGTILHKLLDLTHMNASLDFTSFFDTLPEDEKRYISSVLTRYEDITDQAQLYELLLQLHKKRWKSIVRDVQLRISHAKSANEPHEVERIMHDFLKLKQKIMLQPSALKN